MDFISRAILIHGDKYDYSLVEYKNCKTKVKIICKKHGVFEQKPKFHLRGSGCQKCSEERNKLPFTNTEEFIEKAKKIHGDKYDYSKSIYERWDKKLIIICKEHGEFKQAPSVHLAKCDCPKCSIKYCSVNKSNTEEFIEKAKKIHGDKYDYSKSIYNGWDKKLVIICKKHGEFKQAPRYHIYKKWGCPKCAHNQWDINKFLRLAKEIHNDNFDYSLINEVNKAKDKIKIICNKCKTIITTTADTHLNNKAKCIKCLRGMLTKKEFLEKAKIIHNDKYDYSKARYINLTTKILIICPDHGIFFQRPEHHINGHGCPKCMSSKGENIVRSFLQVNNIVFEEQKKFDDCKNINLLPFDFFLPKLNLIIEYDGEQHYKPIEMYGGIKGFEKRKINDNIKNEFCKINNIKLIRIRYDENINEVLTNTILKG